MGFETKKHHVRAIRINDSRLSYGCNIEVSHWLYDSSGDPRIASILNVYAGPSVMQIDITSSQARELAAKLLEHADELEAHQDWFHAQSKLAA